MESKEEQEITKLSISEWVILILLVLVLVSFVIYLNFFWIQDTNLETFDECKLNLWKSCGLPVYDNTTLMCYRIEGKNSTKPDYCIKVNSTLAECWSFGYYINCVDKFSKFLTCFNNTELIVKTGCSHCEEQIKILDNYVDLFEHRSYLDYFKVVDIAELNSTELKDYEDITSVPTWIINNKTYSGIKTIKELSEITGCQLN